MASPEPSIIHRQVTTYDADEVSAFLTRWVAPVRVVPVSTGDLLGFETSSSACRELVVGETKIKGPLAILPQTPFDSVMLHLGLSGSAQVDHTKATASAGPGDVLVHTTRCDKRLVFGANWHEIVLALPMDIVHDAVERQFGLKLRRPVDLLFAPDRQTPLVDALFAFGASLQAGLSGDAPLLASPIGMRRYRDSFVTLMLTCLNIQEPACFSRAPALASLREVERAEAYMRANAASASGVSDVADHLGISMRMLQYAFRRHRDITALATLRRARLDGFRADLLGGGNELVAAVATRWGFVHLGRMSRLYKAAFGERPSETAARSRRSGKS